MESENKYDTELYSDDNLLNTFIIGELAQSNSVKIIDVPNIDTWMPYLPLMKKLCIQTNNFTGVGLRQMPNLTSLMLDMNDETSVSRFESAYLQFVPSLSVLVAKKCKIGNLINVKNLESLLLDMCEFDHKELRFLGNLKTLCLSFVKIDLRYLELISNLSFLELYKPYEIDKSHFTPSIVGHIRENFMRNIKRRHPVTYKTLKKINNDEFEDIKAIIIKKNNIHQDIIHQLKNLEAIYCENCNYTNVRLKWKSFPKLKWVVLENTKSDLDFPANVYYFKTDWDKHQFLEYLVFKTLP